MAERLNIQKECDDEDHDNILVEDFMRTFRGFGSKKGLRENLIER